jgi:hypothetical protein
MSYKNNIKINDKMLGFTDRTTYLWYIKDEGVPLHNLKLKI